MADRLTDLQARFNDELISIRELYELVELFQARVEELERKIGSLQPGLITARRARAAALDRAAEVLIAHG